MIFVPIKDLQPGMTLERDIYTFNPDTHKIEKIEAQQKLTECQIKNFTSIAAKNIAGAYIDDGNGKILTQVETLIPNELKWIAISTMKQAFQMFEQTAQGLHIEAINQISDVARQLVDIIETNKQIMLNIFDLKLYDDYTYNHSLGVATISIAIGTALRLSRQELCELGLCALMHDIGKTKVPIEIINKPGKLTKEEFDIIKKHPALGAEFMAENHLVNDRVYEGVLSHHEKYDGTGYPNGVAGKDISLFGRIISVADVFDALTSARPYHNPALPKDGIEYIMGGSGKAFDVQVVHAFLQKISPYPVGSCVKLSNGQLAIVVRQRKSSPLRPKVRLLSNPRFVVDLYSRRDMQNIVIENVCSLSDERRSH